MIKAKALAAKSRVLLSTAGSASHGKKTNLVSNLHSNVVLLVHKVDNIAQGSVE